MSNVLYIGPYKQNDGWGYASREYIRSLASTKHNITIQPVYLNSQKKYNKFEEFQKLENNKYYTYDTVIQHTIPCFYEKFVGHQNIGMCFFETNTIKNYWPNHIGLMDRMVICSSKEFCDLSQSLSINSKKNDFCKVIPIPTDVNKYQKRYDPYETFPPASNHTFKFYYVGEVTTRKNIQSLLVAFHSEFRSHELVDLVLKINIVGQEEEVSKYIITEEIKQVKSLLGIYRDTNQYINEIIISKYLSDHNLYALHQACDAYVIGSFGEAFSIPAFDAMSFGNYVIGNINSGLSDFTKCSNKVLLTNSDSEPCLCPDKPIPDLYTAKDTWNRIRIDDLKINMRKAFLSGKEKGCVGIGAYSYEAVGDRFNEIL